VVVVVVVVVVKPIRGMGCMPGVACTSARIAGGLQHA